MKQIATSDNHVIQYTDTQWRLVTVDSEHPRELIKAQSGQAIFCEAGFVSARNLPINGKLETGDIRQVAVGWEDADQSWHLGLLVNNTLAEKRKSRWVELARWETSPNKPLQSEASESALALASLLKIPFKRIEAPQDLQEHYHSDLLSLPLELGVWKLEYRPDDGTIQPVGLVQFIRNQRWYRNKWMRVAWYTFWAVIYIIVSLATLTSEIALPAAGTLIPNPEWLPYLGLAASVLLIGIVLYTLYQILTEPNRILLNPQDHSISAFRGKNRRWVYQGEKVQSIYVTEVLKHKAQDEDIYHGELNLYFGDKKFFLILDPEIQEDHMQVLDPGRSKPQTDTIVELNSSNANSKLQHAGLHIARILGDLPCWYDLRIK
ncbi:hypothetical protein MASR2M15_18580 [Anaerolineales bacterium]